MIELVVKFERTELFDYLSKWNFHGLKRLKQVVVNLSLQMDFVTL